MYAESGIRPQYHGKLQADTSALYARHSESECVSRRPYLWNDSGHDFGIRKTEGKVLDNIARRFDDIFPESIMA